MPSTVHHWVGNNSRLQNLTTCQIVKMVNQVLNYLSRYFVYYPQYSLIQSFDYLSSFIWLNLAKKEGFHKAKRNKPYIWQGLYLWTLSRATVPSLCSSRVRWGRWSCGRVGEQGAPSANCPGSSGMPRAAGRARPRCSTKATAPCPSARAHRGPYWEPPGYHSRTPPSNWIS